MKIRQFRQCNCSHADLARVWLPSFRHMDNFGLLRSQREQARLEDRNNLHDTLFHAIYNLHLFPIILMGKRELIALLNLSSWCHVMV